MTSKDIDDQYLVLDLLQRWIESLEGRRSSKIGRLSTVRQFFEYHRRPLPPTSRNWLKGIKSDVPSVEGKLSVDRLRAVVASLGGDARKLSMVLVQLQSFSGPRELCLIANTMGPSISEQIKNAANLIEVYFPFGRKHSDKSWFSYIGKDGCESLRKWFAIRGYPTKDDPLIWPCKSNGGFGPLTEANLAGLFQDLMIRLGFREGVGLLKGRAIRYGVSVKELRDLAVSIAQTCVGRTNEQNEVFLESSIEYFMGHAVDPMHYRKMHELSPEFRKRQYLTVEPYLNIVSNPTSNNDQRFRKQEEKIESLERRVSEMSRELSDWYATEGPVPEFLKEKARKKESAEVSMAVEEKPPIVQLIKSKETFEVVIPRKKRRKKKG